MNKLIKDNIHNIQQICQSHRVRKLWAFGSVCSDKFSDISDIDLLVSFESMDFGDYADNFFNLCTLFEDLFNRKVDLVTDKSLSNPYFIDSVDRSKIILYE